MMDQIDAASKPGLVTEMLRRHLDSGSKPKVKLKVKMELPKGKATHGQGCECPQCSQGASNQWQA